ncbi:hypothetical protein Tco_0371216 [Tanacetum coccineum]
MAPSRQFLINNETRIAAIIAQQLQTILPQIVTQVTSNVNNANANGGNSGNNRCSYKTFLTCNPRDYDRKGGAVALTRWIEKMESVIENNGCVENQKALLLEVFCPSNKMEKLQSGFWNHTMIGANHVGYTDRFHELAKLVPHLSTILKAGILTDEAVHYGTLTKSSEKRKEVEETSKQGGSWKDNKKAKKWNQIVGCVITAKNRITLPEIVGHRSSGHLRNTCPKLKRAPGQAGNRLALEGNRNTRNNGNQARGRAFSVNAVELISDFLTCLDVIVGMDWLSKNKAEIVCHEKVVRIPLESGEILRVQGERTLGGTKTLMSTKAEEPVLSDIPIVQDFIEVFSEDLLGLPPQRQVEFHIDLIPGATPVAKSLYRLAPSKMQELSEQLQELQDKGFIRPSHSS